MELAHRALITEWSRLKGWLDDDRSGHLVRQQLSIASEQWVTNDHDRGYLLSGSRLQQVQAWADGHPGVLNQAEEAFLSASHAAQRAARRRRVGVGVALVLFPLVAARS